MKIGLMSDTHSFLDDKVFEYFAEVDEIWHAGDIGSTAVADALESFKPMRAVYGNIDNQQLRHRYLENMIFDIDGYKVVMTHIGGYPNKYPAAVKQLLIHEKPHLFICGHSHILKIMPDKTLNLLHMNPGACGNEGFHHVKTLVRFELINAKIQHLQVIEIGPRGRG